MVGVTHLDFRLVLDSRLAILCGNGNLKNTIWVLLEGVRLSVPFVCAKVSVYPLHAQPANVLKSPIRKACVALGAHSRYVMLFCLSTLKPNFSVPYSDISLCNGDLSD